MNLQTDLNKELEEVQSHPNRHLQKLNYRYWFSLAMCLTGLGIALFDFGGVHYLGLSLLIFGFIIFSRVKFQQGIDKGYRNGYVDALRDTKPNMESLKVDLKKVEKKTSLHDMLDVIPKD